MKYEFVFNGQQIIVDSEKPYKCSPHETSMGFTQLMYLATHARELNNDDEINNYILSHKEELNMQNGEGWSPLMLACRNSNYVSTETTVKMLIDAGCDLNLQDENGYTALIFSACYSNKGSSENTVKMLIDVGADLDKQTTLYKWTAVMYAGSHYNTVSTIETVKMLIDAGCDLLNLKTKENFTSLEILISYKGGDKEFLEYCFNKQICWKEDILAKRIYFKTYNEFFIPYLANLYFMKVNHFRSY